MTILVPVMLFGWVPLTVFFFFKFPPQRAVLYSVVGGVLFLPMASYDLSSIPSYGKYTAIAVGLLFGEILSNKRKEYPLQLKIYDLPMIVWCFIVPVATSLSNGLGLYNGFSSLLNNYLIWGVFYWAGRRYFSNSKDLHKISLAIMIGGLIYVPLILFEIRMSPQLSIIFYGFFPHSWIQHIRYGHYRPIVFMQHALMVALWMAASFIISLWLWRSKEVKFIKNIPIKYVVVVLFIFTLLCISANGWVYVFLGIISWLVYVKYKTVKHLQLFALLVPLYMFLRATNIVPIATIEIYMSSIFDQERVLSLLYRLNQEDLFSSKAMSHFFFGWGGYGRGWPIDPLTGDTIRFVDSLWVIVFSTNGFIGLVSFVTSMLIGPWFVLKEIDINNSVNEYTVDKILLSFIVVLFMIDSLINAMVNPVYILSSGALVNYLFKEKKVILQVDK